MADTMNGLNTNTPQEFVLDAGVLVRNYVYNTALASCDVLGVTTGGVKVNITQNIYTPQIDGAYGPVVGTERVTGFDISMSGNLWACTTKSLMDMLLGAGFTFDATHNHITPGPLVAGDYLTNIALLNSSSSNTGLAVGTAFIIKNARGDGKFSLTTKNGENAQQAFSYNGCVTVASPQSLPYEVYTPLISGAVS